MELSPRLDHWFVRPKLFTKLYINNILQTEFDFSNMRVTGKKLPLKNHSLDFIVIVAGLYHISTEEISDYLQQFKQALKLFRYVTLDYRKKRQ